MDIQKLTWILERTLYYTLLLTVGAVIFSFATDKALAGLIALILMMAVIHKGFARITVPAKSVFVQDGKVAYFAPEKSTYNRFDIISRGQKIVTLPVYGVFDRPYKLEVFYSNGEGVTSCLLTLKLAYGKDLPALQCAYDHFIQHEHRFADAVRRQLGEASAGLFYSSMPGQNEDDHREYLEPIVAGLNRGLAPLGVEIKEASCSFDSGTMLARVQLS
jgi:hypothetical protein